MYKITKHNSIFTYIKLSDGFINILSMSFVEYELRCTAENKINIDIFFQDTIPNCDTKYWKNENGIIVEMNTLEKEYVDKLEIYRQKEKDFYKNNNQYKFRVHVSSDKDSALEYIEKKYKKLYMLISNQDSLYKEISTYTDESSAIVYFNEIDGAFAYVISEDYRLTLESLDDYLP